MAGLRQKDFDDHGAPFSFLRPGEVRVWTGPNTAEPLDAARIPLDGRHYTCAGTVIMEDGRRVRAQFGIRTHVRDFLERESVWCTIDGDAWYPMTDPELHELLGLSGDRVRFRWLPDRPLDFHDPGPYPMTWPQQEDLDDRREG